MRSALLVCCGHGTTRSGSPGIFADRIEELADGNYSTSAGGVRTRLTTVHSLLEVSFRRIVESAHTGAEHVPEDDGIPYKLESTLIQFIGRRPADSVLTQVSAGLSEVAAGGGCRCALLQSSRCRPLGICQGE
jgi:hypothetical protein